MTPRYVCHTCGRLTKQAPRVSVLDGSRPRLEYVHSRCVRCYGDEVDDIDAWEAAGKTVLPLPLALRGASRKNGSDG